MSNFTENVIKNNNKLYRKDPFVIALCHAAGSEMEKAIAKLDESGQQMFFDTMTETGVALFEGYLHIEPPAGADLDARRQNVQANWLAVKGKKFSVKMANEVCEAWDRGGVNVVFEEGILKVNFTKTYGVPQYFEAIAKTMDDIKPAHLGLEWIFRTHSWRDATKKTWGFMKERKWFDAKEGEW